MKKFLAILLAAMLLLSVGAVAVADDAANTVTLKKVYKLEGAGSSPAETFNLEVTSKSVSDNDLTAAQVPGLTIAGAEFAAGDASATGKEVNFTVTLPTYTKVGKYTYNLKETAGSNAGVAYNDSAFNLVVTVINAASGTGFDVSANFHNSQNAKITGIENTYKAGSLSVTKEVTGALGDKDKYFNFQVVLTGEDGKTYAKTFTASTSSPGKDQSNPTSVKLGTNNFTLKNGQTFTIENLPYGVSYVVTESDYADYTTTKTGDTGSIDAATNEAKFTNNKGDTSPDTGITTDSLPYVMLLGFVLLAGAALIIKRRVAHN